MSSSLGVSSGRRQGDFLVGMPRTHGSGAPEGGVGWKRRSLSHPVKTVAEAVGAGETVQEEWEEWDEQGPGRGPREGTEG